MSKYIRTVTVFLMLLFASVMAGATGRAMPDAQWQQLTSDTAFSYKNSLELQHPVEANNDNISSVFDKIVNFFSKGIGELIFWSVILLIIGYVVYKVLFNERFSLFKKSTKTSNSQETVEEDIATANWEEHLKDAIKNNDTRLAIRYSYMWLLQLLQHKELIIYKNDKTNYDYYNELLETPYKQSFRQLSREYEYAWYGHFILPEASYHSYMQLFNNLKDQLS